VKKGWKSAAVDEICNVEYGKRVVRKNDAGTKYAVYGGGGETFRVDDYNREDRVVVARFGLSEQCTRRVGGRFFLNDSGLTLSPHEPSELLPEFLDLWTLASNDLIYGLSRGTAQRNLDVDAFRQLRVRYPSDVSEQRRIVAILDEAFEGIAAAKANAEKNLRNAKEVFEAWLRAVFYERRPEWPDKLLKEVCGFENGDRGKNYPNRSEYVDAGIPWINTGHIQPDGTLSINEMNFISKEKYESLRSGKIQPGDLVYCLRGATLGKTALVEPYTVGAIASSLVILRPAQSLNSRFLYYFLTSPVGQGLIRGYENGAAQPNLGAKSVAKYRIPTPSPAEQQCFVKLLDDVSGETSRLTGIYKQKLTALDALKASLLHQAFTGQL
jgi:type I restriction enzyme, S subunit